MTGLRERLGRDGPLIGMWVVSGSAYVAEICAGGGLDWLLVDCEHAPNDLTTVLPQLQAAAASGTPVVVRPPSGDPVVIKQLLDIGVQDLMVPMVESAAQARDVVAAVEAAIATVVAAGTTVGVNAFAEPLARRYLDLGARLVLVGADVLLLARGSEELAARYRS